MYFVVIIREFSFSKACGFQILCMRSEKKVVNSKVSGYVSYRIKRVCGLPIQCR